MSEPYRERRERDMEREGRSIKEKIVIEAENGKTQSEAQKWIGSIKLRKEITK